MSSDPLATLPLEQQRITIGGVDYQINAARDQSALLTATAAQALIPFGLMLWESALALAERLAELGDTLTGTRVLELGAGASLPAIVAAHYGARVEALDIDPLALALGRHNATINGVADSVASRTFDWRTDEPPTGFDLVIGADVVYDRDDHAPVARVVQAALAARGRLLLVDPDRSDTPAFLARLAGNGWQLTTTPRRWPSLTTPGAQVALTLIDATRAP